MQKKHNRLYVKGRHLSYQRGKRNTNPNVSIIRIDGVTTKEDTSFYLGKRVAYVYKAKKEIRGTKIRVIWGRITRSHGNSGCVRANFRHNLPPCTLGAPVRIMLYPSTI
ncbi:hypothetical protein PCANB_000147 [Pneumocystis canis]|nr:hypothetical protein PCK1_000002 [Pneumocystis canis]KAG5439865.1 hypothetical protein PCANB_000147 [Pneumocystis canis]